VVADEGPRYRQTLLLSSGQIDSAFAKDSVQTLVQTGNGFRELSLLCRSGDLSLIGVGFSGELS